MKKVGIIAPSGAVKNFDEFKIKTFFNSKGIEAVISPSCYAEFRYMAGGDDVRINDIHNVFADKTIDTVICLRGGYGALRIINDIDYNLISKNKKPFIGFSDITLLLAAFYKFSALKGFHGKMAANGVVNMNDEEFEEYKNSIENPHFETTLRGGILWGGNLASIVSLFGAAKDFLPDEDIILFIEDINEPDYKIDRMLTQILLNKSFKDKIKGVIFGEFTGSGKYLKEIQTEFINKLDVPYEYNLNITHGENNKVVPFGLKIQ